MSLDSRSPVGVGDKLRGNDGLLSLDSRSPVGVGDKLRGNDGLLSLDSRSLIGVGDKLLGNDGLWGLDSRSPVGVGDKLRGNDGLLSLDSRSLIGVGDKLRGNDGLLSRIQYWFGRLIIVPRQVASAQRREWRLLRQAQTVGFELRRGNTVAHPMTCGTQGRWRLRHTTGCLNATWSLPSWR